VWFFYFPTNVGSPKYFSNPRLAGKPAEVLTKSLKVVPVFLLKKTEVLAPFSF
jgi:hypothetical protein